MGWTASDLEKFENRRSNCKEDPVIRKLTNDKEKKESVAITHIKRILKEYNLIYLVWSD